MATTMELLEKNLDRLDRFFPQRKKKSTWPRNTNSLEGPIPIQASTPPVLSIRPTNELQTSFPQPAFMKPTSSRMLAREEPRSSPISTRRARSLPGPPSAPAPERTSNFSSAELGSSAALDLLEQFPNVPRRASSLRSLSIHRQLLADVSLSRPPGYRVSDGLKNNGPTSIRRALSASGADLASPKIDVVQYLASSFSCPDQRPETPPSSATDDLFPPDLQQSLESISPSVTVFANPTPEPSPTLFSRSAANLSASEIKMAPRTRKRAHSQASPRRARSPATQVLRKAHSDSSLAESIATSSSESSLLEPTLDDDLSLSDHDLAAAFPFTPDIEQQSLIDTTEASSSEDTGLTPFSPFMGLTPSPLSVTRSAPIAAFAIANLAAKYQFDLVYVVNVWPIGVDLSPIRDERYSTTFPAPTLSASSMSSYIASNFLAALDEYPDMQGPVLCLSPRAGMEGRIMAAYGLSGVVSPFVLSAPVLLKVLRKDRWLVYRGKEPAPPDEFSRGYSCAFHRLYGGERIRHPVNEAATTTSSPHDFGEMSSDEDDTSEEYGEENGEKAPNMGLVFAAYRLPRADGTTLESDRAEINALKEDAEALVMTLFDLYADDVQRRKYIERTPAYF